MRIRLTLSTFALALLLAAPASASILTNGDFELLDGTIGNVHGRPLNGLGTGQWDVYDGIPGWVKGDGDAGIEIQRNTVVSAFSPDHYVELDSHPGPGSNSSMKQSVTLEAGQYELSFYYRPRTNTQNDNGITASANDGFGSLSVNTVKNQQNDWERFAFRFNVDADDTPVDIVFEATGIENTLGGFIDNVALHAVPEATTFVVWSLLGIATSVVWRGGHHGA